MLLVDDRKTEVPEYHIVLYQGMGSDDYAYAAVFKTRMDLPAL